MRKHISIFTFLLWAFATVGTAGTAGASTKTAGFPYYTQSGTTVSDVNVVYSTDAVNYIAIPPAGRKVGNWGWADDGSAAQQYGKVNWESSAKTGTTYAVPSGKKAAVYFAYIPLTVSFNGNGGSGSMTAIKDQNYDSDITLPANTFAKTGYQFTGWKTNATKGVVFEDKARLNGSAFWNGASFDSTLYAQWAANTYTVRFDGNGATTGSMQDETFTYDEEQALTANAFVKNGYSFAGWATNATEGAVLYADRALVKNLTVANGGTVSLYARWTASPYTVTFNANGGGTPSPTTKSVTYGSTYGPLATCSRTGYSLDGWYTAASGGTKIETTTPVTITAAQTLYAHWTPVVYTITYNGLKQGATNPNPATYTIETTPIAFKSPGPVTGFTFSNWSQASIEKGSTGDKTVTASYLTWIEKPTPAQYELTYNGGLQTIASGSNMSANGNQATVSGAYTATFTPNSGYCWNDGTVTSYSFNWTIVNAKIENATVTQYGSLTYTGEPQQPQVDARATVKGWQTVTWKYSTSQGDYAETMPSFTDAGTYSVYFEASAPNHDPATGSFTVMVKRSPTAAVAVTPTSLRYTRKEQGPSVTVLHCHEAADSVKRATDVGAYAVKATPDENYAWSNGETAAREFTWSIDDSLYTVQFDGNGGTGEMASTNLAYNEEYVVPECDFTKTGCEFQSWQVIVDNRTVTNYPAGTVVSNLTSVAGKIVTFKADWTGYYTIDFDANGGEGEMVDERVERDVGFQLPSNAFTRIGYDFTMWTTNLPPNEKSLIADGATVTNLVAAGETCMLHAHWNPHHYTITFNANGGKGVGPADMDCTYGEEVPLPTPSYDPPKNYATFIGWSTNKSDTVGVHTVSNLTAEADGIVTVYAVWKYDVGEWSRVLDCDSLKFENGGYVPWVALTNDYGGLSPSYAFHNSNWTGIGELSAVVDGSGTLSFWWKAVDDADWLTVQCTLVGDEEAVLFKTNLLWRSGDWLTDSLRIDLPSGMDAVQVQFVHSNPADIFLDCVTWVPDGEHPEPVDGEDNVTISSAAVSDGKFVLSFESKAEFDYNLLTNADLLVDSWGVMGEKKIGDGTILTFKPEIIEGQPQLFYKVETIQKK